jgi:16S rRNA (adenine1518-N6/adenine1519-N6)-dimethyltransferase
MSAEPKKSLGQHWLNDSASLAAMAAAADVHPGDAVLEIGPGQGSLTAVLLDRGALVTALEFDESLIPDLQSKFKDQANLILRPGDIRSFDFSTLPDDYKIVANIPYYLTANLMRLLTDPPAHKPIKAALLMQKEVTERISAGPGQMAFMSVAAQFYYQVEPGREVPAKLFTPPPKVDSQILILTQRPEPLFPDVEVKDFFRLLKVGFAQRRKTLLNSLSSGLHLSKETVTKTLAFADIDSSRRAQALSLGEWHKIYLKLLS